MTVFWIRLHGKNSDGKPAFEQIASPFPTIAAAMDKAESLMENNTFHWGRATGFTVTDETGNIVLSIPEEPRSEECPR